MNLVAAYTKSGGSWLTWMLIDALHDPKFCCDVMPIRVLRPFVLKTEYPIDRTPDVALLRHPLDICCSWFNYALLTGKLKESDRSNSYDYFIKNKCLLNGRRGNTWDTLVNWSTSSPSTFVVRYEDLNKDTVGVLSQIVPQLPLDVVKSIVSKYSVDRVRIREAALANVAEQLERPTNPQYTFFPQARSFYYRELMTEAQVSSGVKKFHEYIEKYWPESL